MHLHSTAHSLRIHQGLRKGGHGQSGQVLPANAPLGARFYLCTRIAPRSRRIGHSPRTARPLGKAWWGQNLRGRRRPTGGQFEKALQSRTERSRDIRSTWEIACRSSDSGLYCLGMGSQWEMSLEEWIWTHSCGLTVHSVGVVVVEVKLQFLCKRHKICIQYYRHHLVCWVIGRVRYWVGDSQTGSWGALIKVRVEPSEFSTFVKTFHFSIFLKGLLRIVFLFHFCLDGMTGPMLSHLNNAPVEFSFVPNVRKRSKRTRPHILCKRVGNKFVLLWKQFPYLGVGSPSALSCITVKEFILVKVGGSPAFLFFSDGLDTLRRPGLQILGKSIVFNMFRVTWSIKGSLWREI